jgi:hypothetical protein
MEAAAELKAVLVHKWQERQKLLQESATGLKAALTEAVREGDITQFADDSRVLGVISALMTKNEEIKKILESTDAPEGGDFEKAENIAVKGGRWRSTGKLLDKKKVQGEVEYLEETVNPGNTELNKRWVKEQELSKKENKEIFDVQYRMEHIRHGAFAEHAASARTRRAEGLKLVKKDGKPWQEIRNELKETQDLMCGYCKEPLPLAFHVDHVNEDPGNNDPDNLVACCPTCHDRKGRAYSNRKDYILRPMIYRLNINRKGWGQDPVPAVWLENYSKELHFPQYAQYLPKPAGNEDKEYTTARNKCEVFSITRSPRQVNGFTVKSFPRLWRKANMLVGKKVTVKFNDGQSYPGTVVARLKTSHIATARQYKVQYKDKDVWTHNVEELLPGVNTQTKVAEGDLVMERDPPQTFTGIVTSTGDNYTVLFDNGEVRENILEQEAKEMRLRFLLLLQEEQDAMWEVFVPRTADEAVYLTKAFTTPT